ncbi:MAG TPA: hypothetical protein DCP98_05015 [Sphaerochaeta sp.]|nr:hypothetical protein [Sphaerochaeta sp.]
MHGDNKALFEDTPIMTALMKLAVPTVMGQIILVIYNMADTFFISLTNSNDKITAVTVCMPAFMFLSAIANLFGIGGSSVMSRALGKQNHDRVRSTSAFSFWGCFSAALLYALFVFLVLDPFVDFLGGSAVNVHDFAREYVIITIILGGVFTSMNSLMSHLVRSTGMAVHASVGIILGGVLNMVLDPLFMFVILPRGNEVVGAALATALSNVVSCLYFMVLLLLSRRGGKTLISLRLTKRSFTDKIPRKVFNAGLPAFVMTFAENFSYAILDNMLSAYGTAVQAGIGVAKKINMLSHSIVRGITQGALPLIGYNYSAGKRVKTKHIVMSVGLVAVSAATICTLGMFFFAHSLVGLFLAAENASKAYGVTFLRILCVGAPFSALAYTFISFFQAVGHGAESFALALLRKGALDIPMMFILRGMVGMYGIVAATPIVDIICSLVSVFLFLSFASRHLKTNKRRKIYNPQKMCYELEEA